MFEYSHENHYKKGYNQDFKLFKEKPTDKFNVDFSPISRGVQNFKEECITAAKLISQRSKKIFLFLSGGVDSEVIFQSFVFAKIKFTPVILKYHFYNAPDVYHAKTLCQQYGIMPIIFEYDLYSLFEEKVWNYVSEYQICSPPQIVFMEAATRVDGTAIFGMGEPDIYRTIGGNKFYHTEHEYELAMMKFFIKNSREAVPFFFHYTPELMASIVRSKRMLEFFEVSKKLKIINTQVWKWYLYSEFFELIPRNKGYGFDLLKGIINEYRTKINNYDQQYQIEHSEYLRRLGWNGNYS